MKSSSINTRRIALNGILGALAVISLFFAAVLPTNRLALYALSSFFVSITIIEYGIRNGWLFYAATGLLALILVPDKPGIVPYIIFFGIYGIVKFHIEKINKIIPEYVLKVVFFNLCLLAAVLFIKQVFMLNLNVNLPWWLFIIIIEVIFLIYDFVYTLFIGYYRDKLKKKLGL